MNKYFVSTIFFIYALFCYNNVFAKPTCNNTFVLNVLERASGSKRAIKISCNLNLKKSDVITKRLILEGASASNVTINCNGATINGGKGRLNYKKDMIEVRSKKYRDNKTEKYKWSRPKNVTIKNCNIIGSIRVWGMGRNGEDWNIKESSKRERSRASAYLHIKRLRDNAPKNIVFTHVSITGVGRNPLYFSPGVTYSKLINSEMKGVSNKVAIYLDAESAYNTIKNNKIHVKTKKDKWGKIPLVKNRGWPLIAIDASTGNSIINNHFSSLNNGGIYLYRNCGEGGTIRHTTPSRNLIINNVFYYRKYKGLKPAIYIGSRNYGFKENTFGHCDKDEGKPYGSSTSDKDYARYNIILQNQFYKRWVYITKHTNSWNTLVKASLHNYIVNSNTKINHSNLVKYNTIVSREVKTLAGCYIPNGVKQFLLHGQSIDVFKNRRGQPACNGLKKTCNNGTLKTSRVSNCSLTKINFNCKVEGNSRGCRKRVYCNSNKKIIGAVAACNLEYGSVSNAQLTGMPVNTIKVVKESDKRKYSDCFVGGNHVNRGRAKINIVNNAKSVIIGCKEHDKNGGDCHIKGQLYCAHY